VWRRGWRRRAGCGKDQEISSQFSVRRSARSRFLASLEMTNCSGTIQWETDFGETDPWEIDWDCETESFGWDSDSFDLETDSFSWERTALVRGWVDSVLLVLRDP
jgi:hypothetical protein